MDFNSSYLGARSDVVEVLLANGRKPVKVLDIGCATGEVGAYLKRTTGAAVHGVELVPEMAEQARTKLDKVFSGRVEAFVTGSCEDDYDAILLSDVLEHTENPWSLLEFFKSRLAPAGVIVISLPNIRHWDTLYNLAVLGNWPYRDRGIHDRTHLRFFALRNMRDLIHGAGLRIESTKRNLRIREGFSRMNRFSYVTNIPLIRPFFTFQYIFRCAI